MYVVAGPNGAGKSTLVGLLLADVPVVNPDDIARGIDPETPERAAFTAGRHALREVAGHQRAGRTFAVETTLPGSGSSGRWNELVDAALESC
jgi:predicted ABC-type ATPase